MHRRVHVSSCGITTKPRNHETTKNSVYKRRFVFSCVRVFRAVVIVAALGAVPASAQIAAPLTPVQAALICGPQPEVKPPAANALTVRGAQDSRPRGMFSQRDLLVIDGGTGAGVQLGQEFFVRRGLRFGMPYGMTPKHASTVAWIRIVAVNETTAIASVQHVCDAILRDDYLEPFVMPQAPAGVDRDDSTGELDFTMLSRVLGGAESRDNGAAGDLMLMDRGSDQGVAPGARFAVYRDVHVGGIPLAAIGEAVVMTTASTTSVVRLTRTRDAVQTGDYLVPRK